MTCHPLNIDRLQLMSLNRADATMPDANGLAAFITASRPATSLPPVKNQLGDRCEPAENTCNGVKANGARDTLVAARCKRLRHANNVQRLRFLAVHRALATYSAGREQ